MSGPVSSGHESRHGPTSAVIRRFQETDEAAVTDVWYRAGKAVYTFVPAWKALTPEVATRIFRQVTMQQCEIWVGVKQDRIIAFLALDGSFLDSLYVDPAEQRRGWGARLVTLARRLRPAGLTLRTYQDNHAAQAFFEKLGFEAVDFGVSPPPECVPDIVYQWPPRPEPDSGPTTFP